MDDASRAEVLRAHGAGDGEMAELLAYTASPLRAPAEPPVFPLPDEPFVAAWRDYARQAEARGAWPVLRENLVELRFPVAEGISETEEYRAATRRGAFTWPADGVTLKAPEAIRISIHPTPAGHLPVVDVEDRDDFATLVRALTRRNEPHPIPPSMGALAVGGYNNWGRVAALRREWRGANPHAPDDAWSAEWRALMPRRELYQDRFVLLSRGPYSGVAAEDVGVDPEEWEALSRAIRLEHECAHYFSRRVFGSMRNHAFDELVADYAGIVAAAGRYRPDWALRFLGLESHPRFRAGGRLANYRASPPLGDTAFAVLCSLAVSAVAALDEFDATRRADAAFLSDSTDNATALSALLGLTIEDLAAGSAVARLRYARLESGAAGGAAVAAA